MRNHLFFKYHLKMIKITKQTDRIFNKWYSNSIKGLGGG